MSVVDRAVPDGDRGWSPPTVSESWRLVERSGPAGELVSQLPNTEGVRLVCICRPTGPAVILGSTQTYDALDASRLTESGISIARRSSGGGAVYVAPRAQVWLDAFVPAGDPLFDTDVGRSAWWLGEHWAEALAAADGAVGPPRYEVHRGSLVARRWSRTACFAGIGPGEVLVAGRKVVGISQRRTRLGAWLHSMALVENDPAVLVGLLALTDAERADLRRELDEQVSTVSAPAERLTAALVARFVPAPRS